MAEDALSLDSQRHVHVLAALQQLLGATQQHGTVLRDRRARVHCHPERHHRSEDQAGQGERKTYGEGEVDGCLGLLSENRTTFSNERTKFSLRHFHCNSLQTCSPPFFSVVALFSPQMILHKSGAHCEFRLCLLSISIDRKHDPERTASHLQHEATKKTKNRLYHLRLDLLQFVEGNHLKSSQKVVVSSAKQTKTPKLKAKQSRMLMNMLSHGRVPFFSIRRKKICEAPRGNIFCRQAVQ